MIISYQREILGKLFEKGCINVYLNNHMLYGGYHVCMAGDY